MIFFFYKINFFGNCKQNTTFQEDSWDPFQFPSPPMWNNWLSHLLNLYSFVINIYFFSSPLLSSNNFFVSSHLFFFFFFSQGHTKQKNGGQRPISTAISVYFGSHFGQNRTVSAISAKIGLYWPFRLPFPLESGWIKKKKKKRQIGVSNARCRVGASLVWVRQPWSRTHSF